MKIEEQPDAVRRLAGSRQTADWIARQEEERLGAVLCPVHGGPAAAIRVELEPTGSDATIQQYATTATWDPCCVELDTAIKRAIAEGLAGGS